MNLRSLLCRLAIATCTTVGGPTLASSATVVVPPTIDSFRPVVRQLKPTINSSVHAWLPSQPTAVEIQYLNHIDFLNSSDRAGFSSLNPIAFFYVGHGNSGLLTISSPLDELTLKLDFWDPARPPAWYDFKLVVRELGVDSPGTAGPSDTSSPAATPLPAAFSLFATGTGLIAFLGSRRRRKAAAAAK
jgi:hypothetical protein